MIKIHKNYVTIKKNYMTMIVRIFHNYKITYPVHDRSTNIITLELFRGRGHGIDDTDQKMNI